MPITRVGVVAPAGGAIANVSFVLPAGLQDNDVLYAAIAKVTNVVPTMPAGQGYVLLDALDASASALFMWCYGAVLQAADSGQTHTFTFASATRGAVAIILRGCDPAQVLDVTDPPTGTAVNTTSVACPASASASAGAWPLWFAGTAVHATKTFTATNNGNAVTREVGGETSNNFLGLARAEYPAAGTVSALTCTFSASSRGIGKTLIAKPAPVPALVQRWTGSAFTPVAAVQRWDGAAWVPATVKRWDGTKWV